MFWNVSGIILGIALVTTFAVQIVCSILAISISIPVSLINALIVCYLIITNKNIPRKFCGLQCSACSWPRSSALFRLVFFKSPYSVL